MVDKIQSIYLRSTATAKKPKPGSKGDTEAQAEVAMEMINALRDVTRVQDEFNRRIWGQYSSLAPPHAPTHMGGDDSVSGSGLPAPVGPLEDAARGTPQLGFSPHDHVHPWDGGPLDDLLDLDTGPDGVPIEDNEARRALERILLKLHTLADLFLKLADLLGRIQEDGVVTDSLPLPPISCSDVASQRFFAPNLARRGAIIFNNSTCDLFLRFGSGASTTLFTYRIGALSTWEMPYGTNYIGEMTGIWETNDGGNAQVTELVGVAG
jgi:hypothetical protein